MEQKEKPQKVVRCTKCEHKFTSEPIYEYNGESDEDKFVGYNDICEFCKFKIDTELVRIVKNYVEGLYTADEFLEELKSYHPN